MPLSMDYSGSRVRLISRGAVRRALNEILTADPDAHVVGGAVRDILLQKQELNDLDIAVKCDGFVLAGRLARESRGGLTFVPLDDENGVGRLVVGKSMESLDLSAYKGADISEDLRRRDFTVNAMGVPLRAIMDGGAPVILDPLGGRNDLNRRVLRACAADAFEEDPLRIMRAFRFSSTLGFTVESDTYAFMKRSVARLADTAPERVRDELTVVLNNDRAFDAVSAMDDIGVLDVIFPEFTGLKGCEQNRYHHLDVWGHTLEALLLVEEVIRSFDELFGKWACIFRDHLADTLVPGRTRAALVKLATLLHDTGKPPARFVDESGKMRFFGHEKISGEISDKVCARIKLSRKETRYVTRLVLGHMQPMFFTHPNVAARTMRRFARRFPDELPGLLTLYLGDLGASRGPDREPGEQDTALDNIRIMLDLIQGSSSPVSDSWLNGDDLRSLFRIPPGPRMGRILRTLSELQDLGETRTFQHALIAADRIVKSPESSYEQEADE